MRETERERERERDRERERVSDASPISIEWFMLSSELRKVR